MVALFVENREILINEIKKGIMKVLDDGSIDD